MGWGSAIAGAVGSIGGGAVSGGLNYFGSKSLQKYQYELGQRSLEESPTAYKAGLIKAGFNPILAVQNGQIGQTGGASFNGFNFENPVSSAFATKQQEKDLEIADGTVHKLEADINNTQSTEWNTKQDTENKRKQAEILDIVKEQENAKLTGIQSQNANTALRLNRENKVILENPELLERAYKNSLERGEYTNSRGHAIGEDVVTALQLLFQLMGTKKAPINYNIYQ